MLTNSFLEKRTGFFGDLNTTEYTYDSVNQLMSATKNVNSNPDEIFNYDNLGNRLKKNNQTTNNVFDNNNRIVEDDKFFYSHDDNGNMTKKINKSTGYTYKFIWDYENRLQFVTEHLTDGAVAIKKHTYMHDALGRRILKDSNGVIKKYIYDNEDILFEFDNNDALQAKFTHGPGIDEPVEMSRNNQSYFYHTDGLGSITGLSDSNGNIVQSYSYSSFGETKVYNQLGTEINPASMIQSPYGYTAREWDSETNQYFYRARYYDPRTGRFISEDPIHFNGGDMNLYRYVENNPSNFIDPSGLSNTLPFTGHAGSSAYCSEITRLDISNLIRKLAQLNNEIDSANKELADLSKPNPNACPDKNEIAKKRLKQQIQIKKLETLRAIAAGSLATSYLLAKSCPAFDAVSNMTGLTPESY